MSVFAYEHNTELEFPRGQGKKKKNLSRDLSFLFFSSCFNRSIFFVLNPESHWVFVEFINF